jgi:6,7-dimethyl-8-ribityllumazine synthase
MSKALPARPRIASRAKHAFALVVSSYNGEYTSALEKNARAELLAIHPGAKVETFEAPGSFEIPLLVNLLAKRKKYDAVLGLGVIIEGRTAHASLIAGTITQSLQKISLEHSVPVIHEVLLVKNEAQARERCLGAKLNRGREAARAAAAVVQALAKVTSNK